MVGIIDEMSPPPNNGGTTNHADTYRPRASGSTILLLNVKQTDGIRALDGLSARHLFRDSVG
jgi:hypothetical protein